MDFVQSVPNMKEMEAGYNEAEFLAYWVTDADSQGQGDELVEHSYSSALAKENQKELEE